MSAADENSQPVEQLSRDDIAKILETEAQERLHTSAIEMVTTYRNGKCEDPGAIADLLMLASLLAPEDELSVELVAC